jgi:antitoxin component YwqK of YwqJK toxin-antitoxin module
MQTSSLPGHSPSRNGISRLVLVALAAAVLAVAGLVALHLTRNESKPTVVVTEVSRRDLALHDGRWYWAGSTNPYTGWVTDKSPDGTPLFRSAVSNGMLNGLSQGWYTNGQLQIQEFFKDNLSHGLRQKWYANGRLMSEATIVEGKLEGTFRRWHDNGQLAEQFEMKNDKPDGLARGFYPSGFPHFETEVRAGVVLARHTHQDGEQSVSE